MTLQELIQDFRATVRDTEQPYLWGDDRVQAWLDEAEQEACIRGRLLHESCHPLVCELSVKAGVAVYPLHSAVLEITHLSFEAIGESQIRPLPLCSTEDVDAQQGIEWRTKPGRVMAVIQMDKALRLAPLPETEGLLRLECYRLPLRPLSREPIAVPEIHAAHHRMLVDWALHKAYSVPDSDLMDLERSAQAEQAFSRYFGARPDCDLRRQTRHDVPHHNTSHWV